MSIIVCPGCSRKISSRSASCTHCGFAVGKLTEEQMSVGRLRRVRDRVYQLRMISYVALSALVGAFGWYWWGTDGFQQPSPQGPLFLMGLSGVAYLVTRGFLLVARLRQKELQRSRV